MPRGKVTKWYPTREFGFLKPNDGGSELHFHRLGVEDPEYVSRIAVGDAVWYAPGTTKPGTAQDIRPVRV
jgi:cold shock CspA family protein